MSLEPSEDDVEIVSGAGVVSVDIETTLHLDPGPLVDGQPENRVV